MTGVILIIRCRRLLIHIIIIHVIIVVIGRDIVLGVVVIVSVCVRVLVSLLSNILLGGFLVLDIVDFFFVLLLWLWCSSS